MHGEREDVLASAQANQQRAKQRTALEIEWPPRLLVNQPLRIRFEIVSAGLRHRQPRTAAAGR